MTYIPDLRRRLRDAAADIGRLRPGPVDQDGLAAVELAVVGYVLAEVVLGRVLRTQQQQVVALAVDIRAL